MAEKTIVDKAGETVGIRLAAASDVADAIKTAIKPTAMTTVAEVLKKAPAEKATKKAVTKSAAKKAPAKKITKKAAAKKAAAGERCQEDGPAGPG